MPLRTAVNTITVARGTPKEKIEVYAGSALKRMVAPLVRIPPGKVVDLTQDELDALNRDAPKSIRKPTQEELDAYKAAGGTSAESKAATPTDQQTQATTGDASTAEAAAKEAAAKEAAAKAELDAAAATAAASAQATAKASGKKASDAPADDATGL